MCKSSVNSCDWRIVVKEEGPLWVVGGAVVLSGSIRNESVVQWDSEQSILSCYQGNRAQHHPGVSVALSAPVLLS